MREVTKEFLKEILQEAKADAEKEIERKRNLILLREDLAKIKRDREIKRGKTKFVRQSTKRKG